MMRRVRCQWRREKLWDDVPAQRPGMEREIAGLGMFLAG